MEDKFRHEDHNRQEKTRKPDYREDFVEESRFKASAFYLEHFKHYLESHKEMSQNHQAFKMQLMRQYYAGLFEIGLLHFRFHWNFKDCWANNQGHAISNKIWKAQKITASHDLDTILAAINEDRPFDLGCVEGCKQMRLCLTVRIQSDSIVPQQTCKDYIPAPTLYKNECFYYVRWTKNS